MAAKAAPAVNRTQSPCTVQVMRNHANRYFMASNRESEPATLTRAVRNAPSRNAQTVTMTAISRE